MKGRLKFFIGLFYFFSSYLTAEQVKTDSEKFSTVTNFKGVYNPEEKVFKVSFPRNDIRVTVDHRPLDAFMGLTTWVAFKQKNENEYCVMGDIVLFEDEVNPVLTSLLNDNIAVTGLHTHFFYDTPNVYFMHISGMGGLAALSDSIRRAMETTKDIRKSNASWPTSFKGRSIPSANSVSRHKLESIFGTQAQTKMGVVKFAVGRKANMGDLELGKDMGINTWAAFGGSDDNAVVHGDFALREDELQPVLKVLRKGNINVVAIHSHMVGETPRYIFVHYWGKGNALTLAKTLYSAMTWERTKEQKDLKD